MQRVQVNKSNQKITCYITCTCTSQWQHRCISLWSCQFKAFMYDINSGKLPWFCFSANVSYSPKLWDVVTSTWQTCAFSLPWPAVVILTVCSGTSIQMQSRACSRKRSNSKESQLRWGRQNKMHIWICVPYFHHPYLVKVKQWSWIQLTAHTSILQKCSQ